MRWSCPYGAREMDPAEQVMKKCNCALIVFTMTVCQKKTDSRLCADMPDKCAYFGDLGDPNSEVSLLVAARGGMDLMPEQGTNSEPIFAAT